MIAIRSSRRGARTVAVRVAALVAGVAGLSACGVGLDAQTSEQVSVIGGASAISADQTIALRDLVVEYDDPAGYPRGASARLEVRIFNNGRLPVRLTRVAADGAERVALVAAAGSTVTIAPGSYALLVPGRGPYLRLVGLTRPLAPGQSIPLTFAFDNGATISVAVPIAVPTQPAGRGTPVPRQEE